MRGNSGMRASGSLFFTAADYLTGTVRGLAGLQGFTQTGPAETTPAHPAAWAAAT
jgi:hypothetical protein